MVRLIHLFKVSMEQLIKHLCKGSEAVKDTTANHIPPLKMMDHIT